MYSSKPKLLYIMMDGFRWDYLEKDSASNLPGFTKFISEGMKAQWLDPIFPSFSYPTWTTLVTGLYAESHGVYGNYMYDAETKDVFALFNERATGMPKWWTAEPIWTTAEKAGMKTAQYLWSRCDVPFDGVQTHFCQHFQKLPGKDIFHDNIMNALEKFDTGYDFVQVYTEDIDNAGHNYGPDSEAVRQSVRDLDDVINTLLAELEDRGITDLVNIVIVSDHGMMYTAPGAIMRHEVDHHLNASLVDAIVDRGALMHIAVSQENLQEAYEQLKSIPGAKVYKREDIPEEWHFKKGKYVNDILVVADDGNFLMPSSSDKQIPPKSDFIFYGAHGFTPEIKSMRGIFFAKGPAFRQGIVIDPINVVDVYQVLTNVLQLNPLPNNGTWDHVEPAFKLDYRHPKEVNNASATFMASYVLLLLLLTLINCL